jgi:hypothetical protein
MYYQSDDETVSVSSDNDVYTISTASISDSDSDNDNDNNIENVSTTSESILIEFDEYSDDEEDQYTIDEIYTDEQSFLDSEKQNGKYYIGLAKHMKSRQILLLNTISTKTFYKYSYIHVLKYLYYYSIVRLYQPRVEIMKLYILNDGTYSVVLKTHWIRLIQRHWRKALLMRKQIMKKQMHLSSLYHREIYGRFPYGMNKIPMLSGLMSRYSTY